MAYFEPQIYRAIDGGPLRFNIMKFCCIMKFECINVYLTGIFVYKVINKLLLEIFLSYFLKITFKHKYSTRATSGQGLIIKYARTNYHKFVLTIRWHNVWNDIPISIRQVDNIRQFKRNWMRYLSES